MIRVYKSPNAPLSLSTTKGYDGADVQQQLEDDHYKKCYLCERSLCTEFQIEHHRSQENHPAFRQDWNNLFWSCGYCNGKKGSHFDNMLNPIAMNIEEEIVQELDFTRKQASFTSTTISDAHDETCKFLLRVHNGTNQKGIRTKREENFIEHVIGIVSDFYRLVSRYLSDSSIANEELVRESLQIDKECLGFKYWIIKKHPQLSATFANDIVWNKQ